MRRVWRSTLVGVLMVASSGGLGAAAAALTSQGSPTSYDAFNDWTFNDVVAGSEVAYSSGAPFTAQTPVFSTASYTTTGGEAAPQPNNHNGCVPPSGQVIYAGRTAWFRFNPAVAGKLVALATTPGYDSIVIIHSAPRLPWDSTKISDLTNQQCSDQTHGAGNETSGIAATDPANVYYIQIGGVCASLDTCDSAPGGDTQVRLTFVPFDGDGDGVPDTDDQCPGQGTAGGVNAEGCPDADHDGIRDAQDACPTQPGVAAAGPFNGCPSGPTPPSGVARVTITSTAGDPLNTTSTSVLLSLDWPQGTQVAYADNGVGENPVAIDFAHQPVEWSLPATAKSESRQVNVRFVGPGIDETRSDTITLDAEAPVVPTSVVLPPAAGKWGVGLKLSDGSGGSGVASFSLLDKHRDTIHKPVVCQNQCSTFLKNVALRGKPKFVRVVDVAGNSRDVKLKAARSACSILVFAVNPPTAYDCFTVGDSCRKGDNQRWQLAVRGLACVREHGTLTIAARRRA